MSHNISQVSRTLVGRYFAYPVDTVDEVLNKMDSDIEIAIKEFYEVPKLTVSKVKEILKFILTNADILAYVEDAMQRQKKWKSSSKNISTLDKKDKSSEEEGEIIDVSPKKPLKVKLFSSSHYRHNKYQNSSQNQKFTERRDKEKEKQFSGRNSPKSRSMRRSYSRPVLSPYKSKNDSRYRKCIKKHLYTPVKKPRLSPFCPGKLLSQSAIEFERSNKKTYENRERNKMPVSKVEKKSDQNNSSQSQKRRLIDNDHKIVGEQHTLKRLKTNKTECVLSSEKLKENESTSTFLQHSNENERIQAEDSVEEKHANENEILIISVDETLEQDHSKEPKIPIKFAKNNNSIKSCEASSENNDPENQIIPSSSSSSENPHSEKPDDRLRLNVTIPTAKIDCGFLPKSPVTSSPTVATDPLKSSKKKKKNTSSIITYQVCESPNNTQSSLNVQDKCEDEMTEQPTEIKENVLPHNSPHQQTISALNCDSNVNSEMVSDITEQENLLNKDKTVHESQSHSNANNIKSSDITSNSCDVKTQIEADDEVKIHPKRCKSKRKSLSPSRKPFSNVTKSKKLPTIKVKLPIHKKPAVETKTFKPTHVKKCMKEKVFKSVYTLRLEKKLKALEMAEAQAKYSTDPVIHDKPLTNTKPLVKSPVKQDKSSVNTKLKETVPVVKPPTSSISPEKEPNNSNEVPELKKTEISPNDIVSWNRKEDMAILATIKKFGQTDEAFQMAANAVPPKTAEQVKERFLSLMETFKKKLQDKNLPVT